MAIPSSVATEVESPSRSQYISSTYPSLHQSKRTTTETSKTYKHASQLYLTRRLVEAYEVLEPVIQARRKEQDDAPHNDQPLPPAPIALANTSQRIKIWSLYITLLNAIIDLGPEDGKRDFGWKQYAAIVRSVRNGEIWEQVVRDGYYGREGSVDAEVVYNLSNLLLAQAPDQLVNQSRLETYLSSSPTLNLDISEHLNNSINGRRLYMNGASTPKDLSSRIKILELFTLHVLPRNNEWDYARTFVNGSDVLDEERREAFLQTLEELQFAKEQETGYTSVEEDYGQEPEMLEPIPMQEEDSYKDQQAATTLRNTDSLTSQTTEISTSLHRHTSSEIDYGIEAKTNGVMKRNPQLNNTQTVVNDGASAVGPPPKSPEEVSVQASTQAKPSPPPALKSSATTPAQRSSSSQKPTRKPSKPVPSTNNPVFRQARHIFVLLRTIASNITSSLSSNPTILFRTLMFVFAFLILMSRREVRERVRRIMSKGWMKVRGTVGMGVKVSYI